MGKHEGILVYFTIYLVQFQMIVQVVLNTIHSVAVQSYDGAAAEQMVVINNGRLKSPKSNSLGDSIANQDIANSLSVAK